MSLRLSRTLTDVLQFHVSVRIVRDDYGLPRLGDLPLNSARTPRRRGLLGRPRLLGISHRRSLVVLRTMRFPFLAPSNARGLGFPFVSWSLQDLPLECSFGFVVRNRGWRSIARFLRGVLEMLLLPRILFGFEPLVKIVEDRFDCVAAFRALAQGPKTQLIDFLLGNGHTSWPTHPLRCASLFIYSNKGWHL